MDAREFQDPESGRVVPLRGGHFAFVPSALPPRLRFTRELVVELSRADAALGELCGVGGELPDPQLLDAPFKRQEALCSSRIEGADVSLSDLLLDQVGAARASVNREHLREVRSCIATLRFGVERLAEVPLSLDLVRELHERLLRGELGMTRTPGEFRTTQNWIGPPGVTLATATYVPPPAAEMREALDAWESFLTSRGAFPDLIQCAMLHEQFEAIHPFVGGNGRLGRLLITLFLMERRRLTRPLLYLSAYLEAHRAEYYRLLQRVRTQGEWVPWLLFFVTGVRETAERATRQARALIRQHATYHDAVKGRALDLADELFRTPCMTVPEAQRVLGVTNPTARRAVRELEAKGLLEEYQEKRWPRVYLARPVLDAILHPVEELRSLPGADAGPVLKSDMPVEQAPMGRADRMMAEAMAIIDTARTHGAQLRLIGGLAIRRYCVDLEFMERDYSDIDLIGIGEEVKEIHAVFTELGYVENRYVSQATQAGQLQFIKIDALEGRSPLVDHVDVFLDVMRMDHDLDVSDRLDIDDYSISPADALVAKLQIGRINQKDIHDVIALVKDMSLRDDGDDAAIDTSRMADLCSSDWGLYHDVTANLDQVASLAGDFGLSEVEVARVRRRVAAIKAAIEDENKPMSWRLRAAVGQRVAWRREIEETEGTTQVIAPEWDWRRDLG